MSLIGRLRNSDDILYVEKKGHDNTVSIQYVFYTMHLPSLWMCALVSIVCCSSTVHIGNGVTRIITLYIALIIF